MADPMSIDDKDIRNLEKQLGKFGLAVPIANQQALNEAAKDTKVEAVKIIEKKMITRNKWTTGSIQVEFSKGLFKSQTPARVGSMQDYMADQEFGTVAKKGGKEGRRITTSYAAGEGLQARPRRKVARGANKIRKIRLQNKRRVGKTKRQQAVVAIKQAKKSGRKFVFLNMPWTKGKKGIYKVMGGKRKIKIKMVHSLKKQSVVVPKRPWLAPAVAIVIPRMGKHYHDALQKQADRHLKKL